MSLSSNFPAIKPSLLLDFANTKQLDPRVTFARATTATYYDGVTTAKAEENLLLQSQAFDTSPWTAFQASVSANTVAAPDGTTTAETITATATSNPLVYQAKPFSTSGTISIYLKKGTSNFGYIYVDNPTLIGCYFDLNTGVVGSFSSPFTSTSIVSVGNGWYRCIASFSGISGSNLGFGVCDANGSPNCTVGQTIYAWGAQIEQRSTATAYTATTTQPITNYIPVLMTAASGVPRFDHNPTTDESLGLLIEEARTNLFTYSAQLDNAAWTKTNTTITADTIVAPDGTLTGDKVVENTAAGFHFVRQNISVSAAAHTISFFAKAAERSFVWATLDGGSNQGWFNLSAGTTGLNGSGSTQITSVGNGWYRCSYTATLSAGTAPCFIYLATSTSSASYTGDGFSGVFLWGAQLEAGAFATSYIPTVASTVTRNADAASMTGTNFSSWYSASEGTLYAEANAAAGSVNFPGIAFLSGTGYRSIGFYYSSASTGSGFEVGDGVSQANIALTATAKPGFTKFVGSYATNNFAACANGGTVGTDASGSVPVVDSLKLGRLYNDSYPLNGTIKKIAYYPMRVTNAQLQALTS